MQQAEKIEQLLSWKGKRGDDSAEMFSVEKLAGLSDRFDLTAETVHIDLLQESLKVLGSASIEQNQRSFVFVAPRYFRGIGLDEELSAYLEFCNIVMTSLVPVMKAAGLEFRVKILHPQLVDMVNGFPLFASRAPHPAIVFTLIG